MINNNSILYSEINEQAVAIDRLLQKEKTNVENIVNRLRGKFKYVIIAARGTSDNAARYAAYLFGAHNQLQVALATPSLFTLYNQPPQMSDALVIGISQSGQSPDIVAVLSEAKKQGRPTIAITNEPDSPLGQLVDHLIPLQTGPEKAVAASKTYTSSLATVALFSCLLEQNPQRLQDLYKTPEIIQTCLKDMVQYLPRVERYRYIDHCAVIGRGFNYATAFEISLKIKELNRIVAEPYSSADFRHGPIATVRNGFPVIVVAPQGAVNKDMREVITDIKKLGAELIIISDMPEILQHANLPLPIPAGLPEWLTPLAAVIPGQLFSWKLTIEKGLNPDQPFGLQKVTETL
jgi:glutamine---fructose-6-phosphate transaminase (isomerizing)